MFLQFDEEAFFAEDVEIFSHQFVGEFHIAVVDGFWDFASHAAGGADDAVAVGGHVGAVDAWFVVVPFELGGGGDVEEVEVAGLVLCQQEHVVSVFVFLPFFVFHAAHGEVGFDADDRFDARFFGGAVEGHGSVHYAVIGEGDGGLVEFDGAVDEIVDAAEAVEEAVFAVVVEVDEWFHRDRV